MQAYLLKALELCPNEASEFRSNGSSSDSATLEFPKDAGSAAKSLLTFCKPLVKLTKAFQEAQGSTAEALNVLQFIAECVPHGSKSLLEQGELNTMNVHCVCERELCRIAVRPQLNSH